MEIVIWCSVATLLGFGLGYLGYLYSKLAYSIFVSTLGIFVFGSSYIVDLTGGDSNAVSALHSDAAQISGFGIVKNLTMAIEAMGYFPFHVQVAILVFTFAFFASRIATWAYQSFGPKPAEETPADRKARVLACHGLNSMDDIRSLR